MGKPQQTVQKKSFDRKDNFFKCPKTTKQYSSNKVSNSEEDCVKGYHRPARPKEQHLSKTEDSNDFFIKKVNDETVSGNFRNANGKKTTKIVKQDSTNQRFKSSDVIKPSEASEHIDTKEKKPFDKKKWRIKKYSKKYKLQQWEERRKKAITREYYKQIKTDQPEFDVQKIYEEDNSEHELESSAEHPETSEPVKQKKAFPKPHDRYKQIQHEKEEKKAEALKRKEEREAAIKAHQKLKFKNNKKFNMKTAKGQPIMKHRMELLLEQIQKQYS